MTNFATTELGGAIMQVLMDGHSLRGQAAALGGAPLPAKLNATTLAPLDALRSPLHAQGTGRGKLLIIGDSTSMGSVCRVYDGNTNLNGAFAKAYPRGLATLLNGYVPTSDNSFLNNQSSLAAYGSYDTRVVLGTGGTNAAGALTSRCSTMRPGRPGRWPSHLPGRLDTINIYYLALAGSVDFSHQCGRRVLSRHHQRRFTAAAPRSPRGIHESPKARAQSTLWLDNNGSFYSLGVSGV